MSRPLRLILALLGLCICLCAVGALVYVLWPLPPVREQVPIAPTLFAPPGVASLWWLLP